MRETQDKKEYKKEMIIMRSNPGWSAQIRTKKKVCGPTAGERSGQEA
jgi:hypothetical protein